MRRPLLSLLVVLCAVAALSGQTQSRIATTRALLMKHSLFFHSRTVALADTPRLSDGVWRLAVESGRTLAVVFRTAPTTDGPVEIRGTFVDVGRFAPDDSRISAYQLGPIVTAVSTPGSPWPLRDTVFAIVNATAQPLDDARTTSIRALAMFPERFDGKPVKLRGRFRGRNLVGDLPTWPRQTQSDFVLQAADGAVWVTGVKPKGKGFDLDPTARRDLGRWLEVSGTMGIVDGLPIVRATAIAQASPEDEGPLEVAPAGPVLPPPTVNFSVPTDGEDGIAVSTSVQVQFSRDMKADSFEGHVRVTATVNGATVPVPAFTTNYRAGNLAVELKFAAPLPRFATVVVEFLEGIITPDRAALVPTKITFTTGG